MRSIHVLTFIIAAVVSIASASGVAEDQNRDRTGSPDGSNTCAQCHTGGGFSPTVSIEVLNDMDEAIEAISPGDTYTLRVQVENFFPFPDVYGFQATALMEDLSNAGEFSNPGIAVQIEEVNNDEIQGRHVVEHSNPNIIGVFNSEWTAPIAGDSVYFYAAGVTANGNDEPEGDNGANISLTLPILDPNRIEEMSIPGLQFRQTEHGFWLEGDGQERIPELKAFDTTGRPLLNERDITIPHYYPTDHHSYGMIIIQAVNGSQQSVFKCISY